MEQVNISQADIDWAASRVAAGEYPSVEAYFSALTQRDRAEAEETEWLQREIDKGLASGMDPRAPAEIFGDIRAHHLRDPG